MQSRLAPLLLLLLLCRISSGDDSIGPLFPYDVDGSGSGDSIAPTPSGCSGAVWGRGCSE